MRAPILLTDAIDEVLSTEEAKDHLRVTGSAQDDYIGAINTAARQHCENICNRSFLPQEWALYLDCLEEEIRLERAGVTAVTSIKYIDENGLQQTLSPSKYQTDLLSIVPRICVAYGETYPAVRSCTLNAVEVKFTAGYANAAAVPGPIKQAIKLVLSALFDNRAAIAVGVGIVVKEMPMPIAVPYLLAPYRLVAV